MKVRILVEAPYSTFEPGKAPGAKVCKLGDEVDFPAEYAKGLVEVGLAEAVSDAQVEAEEEAKVEAEEAEEGAKPKTIVVKRARSADKEE